MDTKKHVWYPSGDCNSSMNDKETVKSCGECWGRDRLIIANQLQSLLLVVRSDGRFNFKSHFIDAKRMPEHLLLQRLLKLHREVMVPSLERQISEEAILKPFCDLCANGDMSDTIVGLALTSLSNIVDLKCSFVTKDGLEKLLLITRSSKGWFVENPSDEVVLARRLQICVSCASHPSAHALPEIRFVEMVQHAYTLAMHPATSPLLRRTTEQAMKAIVSSLYNIIVECKPSHTLGCTNENGGFENETSLTGVTMLRYICSLISGSEDEKESTKELPRGEMRASSKAVAMQLEGLWLVQAMLLVVKDQLCKPGWEALLHGVQHDLCRVLLVKGVQTENVILLSQILRTVHIVTKMTSAHVVPQTFSFIKALHLDPIMRITGDLSSGLISSKGGAMSPRGAFSPSVSSATFFPMSLSKMLDLCERREIFLESLVEFCSDTDFVTFCYTQYDLSRRFLPMLERLSTVLVENCFYVGNQGMSGSSRWEECENYSGDYRIDDSLNRADTLALEAIAGLLRQTLLTISLPTVPPPPSVTALIEFQLEQRKLLMEFASLFRKDAIKEGIPFLLQKATRVPTGSRWEVEGDSCWMRRPALLIEEPTGGREVGISLFHLSDVLDKSALGDYLGELGRDPPAPTLEADAEHGAAHAVWERGRENDHSRVGTVRFYEEQLKGFLQEFDYRNKSLLTCIRETAYRMCMPGEAQKIDRVMEAFAKAWLKANRDAEKEINPFFSEQGPFILAFSLIMLNTDQHSGKLSKPMTKEDFKRVHRDSDGGNPLPEEYLNSLYDDVKAHPIIMAEMIDAGFTNDVTWALEMQEHTPFTSPTGNDYSLSRSMHSMPLDETELGVIQLLHMFAFRSVWNCCLTAFANAMESCGVLLRSYAAEARGVDEDVLERDPPSSTSEHAYNCALDGLCLLAKGATHFGVASAVDHVILVFLSQLRLDVYDGHQSLLRLGSQRHTQRCLRKLFHVLNECIPMVVDSWGELGLFFAKLFVLGMFDAGPKMETSGTEDLWEELRISPGSIVSGAKSAPSEGGWLAALWGTTTSLDRVRAQESEERKAMECVKALLPTLVDFLKMIDKLKEKQYQHFFRSLCEVGSLKTRRTTDMYVASYAMILITEATVRRFGDIVVLDCYLEHCRRILSVFFSVYGSSKKTDGKKENGGSGGGGSSGNDSTSGSTLGVSASVSTAIKGDISDEELGHMVGSETYDLWLSLTTRVVNATMRAVKYFACNTSTCKVALSILDLLTTIPTKMFSVAVAPVLSSGLFDLVVKGDSLPFTPDNSLLMGIMTSLRITVGRCETPLVLRQAQATIGVLVKKGQYDSLQHTEEVVNTLVTCSFRTPPTVDEETPVASPITTGTVVQEEALENFADKLTFLCRRFVTSQNAGNVSKSVVPWHQSWIVALRGLCSLVLLSRQYRDKSEALLCLQRCLLDSEIKQLPAPTIARLYDELVFPLTEQMCASSSPALSDRGGASEKPSVEVLVNSIVSQSLVTSLFSSLAPIPPAKVAAETLARQARAKKDKCLVTLDLRCRVVSLLPKVLLHYVKSLRDAPEILQDLWQRILGTLYALYTAPSDKNTSNGKEGRGMLGVLQENSPNGGPTTSGSTTEDEVVLREAIQEAVKNMIYVLAATLSEPDCMQIVEQVPHLWMSTKKLLRTLDFAEPLLVYIDSVDNNH